MDPDAWKHETDQGQIPGKLPVLWPSPLKRISSLLVPVGQGKNFVTKAEMGMGSEGGVPVLFAPAAWFPFSGVKSDHMFGRLPEGRWVDPLN